mmetsp:Transcript_8798/g.12250  ORF Transcript_8798/g.12250 Transcript_8798/m.12250 type:complete len:600 (+) Transcript_8798:53-1852(+)|eukprot:CAMPEP_0197288772 /NCGR_PEP_ID=MMETSP0890-20130614/5939_1 /TAXON_ID=44058 ORGANISM="Aureoumbra lagunensis, Strain CCMP1510" /NCGR_SAMPLE_ID=MMETSP0890 /ASSEMBLY_ACC=CAM_ASM_000533 /LENGTH=599 /DNA_ID=CAMNT_0042759751 /DNA_START=18 /DNA_END=1817 /DNA_ORIENTATION=+
MNPDAPAFNFNPSAGEFIPPSADAETVAAESWEEEEEVDENDPLWKVTLKLAAGDRAKAMQMLADPDSLTQHAEIRAVMEGTAILDDDTLPPTDTVPATNENENELPPPPSEAQEKEITLDPPTVDSPNEEKSPTTNTKEADNIEEEDARQHLNLVFIGHVDAGKSTLSGNMLYLTDHVDKRTIEKYEREAKQRNRESWFLAFIMDTNEEERAKGKTVEVGRAPFTTEAKRYTILDAPGHKNYVPHMISGAAQADVGILVISARRGEFETGFERGGQTREHAMLAKTLGVRHLIVVVNKMDDPTVKWDKKRYEECVTKLRPFLKQCGYTIKKEVKFLAISGLTGANVLKEVDPKQCDWWNPLCAQGGNNTSDTTLLGCLDNLIIAGRSESAPLRIPILDRYHERGTIALGKVEQGRVTVGDDVVLSPTNIRTKIEQVIIGETHIVRSAKPGENVSIKLANIGTEDINKGFVLCAAPPSRPCPAVTRFTAQIALVELLEHRPVFSAGYDCMLHAHTCDSEVTVTKLLYQVNATKAKSAPSKKALAFAKQGAVVVAVLSVPQSICLEAFDDVEQLGRFTLRDEGKSIAIGKVLSLDTTKAK